MTVERRTARLVARCSIVGAVAAGLGAVGASTAYAHIDPDPEEAPAGSEQSVGFTVEHGCAGSPTIELSMQLPEGVSSVVPEPPEGWTAAVDADVVTFTGGVLVDDVEGTFRVRMLLPFTPDVTIYFPFVQRCEVGELRWIDVPQDGSGDELDEPAPAMVLTAPLPGTTEPPPSTTAPPTTTPPTAAPPTTAAPASTATATPSTATRPPTTVDRLPTTSVTVVSTTSAPETTQIATAVPSTSSTTALPPSADEDGTSVGLVIAVVVGALIAAGVVFWQMRRPR